jgi:hypothetical protein
MVETMTGNGAAERPEVKALVDGSEACKRLEVMLRRRWGYNPQRDDEVFRARNAVVHLALDQDEDIVQVSMQTMVRLVNTLLRVTEDDGLTPTEFWGDCARIADAIGMSRRS